MKKINVGVFPCGSEVGLEINRALRFSRHFHLIGLNSTDDYGRVLYEDYNGDLPPFNEEGFLSILKSIIQYKSIRFLIPTMDEVASFLKKNEQYLDCEIVCADQEIANLLISKKRTYKRLKKHIPVPDIFEDFESIKANLPVFTKPNIGYGSRNIKLIETEDQLEERWNEHDKLIFCENLPGKEYTIDCFSDKNQNVLYSGARLRKRIRMGISVNTIPVKLTDIQYMAQKISEILKLKGLWFFQVKEDKNGKMKLLEVASRVSGSMALYRLKGINFVQLELFQRMGYPISIQENIISELELERAFSCNLISNIKFNAIYVDFDDCLFIDGKLNSWLLHFLYQQLNKKVELILISKHNGDLIKLLKKLRVYTLFDEIIHIEKENHKYKYVKNKKAIFIDDSYREREDMIKQKQIPSFAPDVIPALIDNKKI